MTHFICYNGKFIASRKSLKAAVAFINARDLHEDENNELYITDEQGWCYYYDVDLKEWI